MNATISASIIVKNEINNIPYLVDDLRKFCDEINIIDTGSDDGTFDWLYEHQDGVLKLYEFEWCDDFSAARNFSFSKATMDWIFWCDADDRISIELINKINELKSQLNSDIYNVYSMIYKYSNDCEFYRARLFKRSCNPIWECCVHECAHVENTIDTFLPNEYKILHFPKQGNVKRNIEMFEKNIERGKELSIREKCYYAREINWYPERRLEAQNIAYNVLFAPDAPELYLWEIIIDILIPSWMESVEKMQIGIAILDRFEKIKRLRGDIYYYRALMYYNIGEQDLCIKDCYNAINTVVYGNETYKENIKFSKIYPAEWIKNNSNDPIEIENMDNIINMYK